MLFYYAFSNRAPKENLFFSFWRTYAKKGVQVKTGVNYYPHGPLARTEIGEDKVQGMDYVYTINGWQKGCNSNNLSASNDMGQDGETSTSNLNKNIARDAYGYSLNYFSGDYHPIGTFTTSNNLFASATAAAYLSTDAPGLYNGNISSMVTSLTDIAPGSSTLGQAIPQLTAYRYDQLNRVKQMKAYRDINLGSNTWGDGSTYDGSYETHLSYDANGNILTMQRNGVAGVNVNMDNLAYTYETVANGYAKNTNKLRHVNDNTSYTSNYQTDIDDQGTFSIGTENYDYDEIGNQKQDKSEGIASEVWNVYGKLKSITRYTGSLKPDLEFNYDAMGQRISKLVIPRDASGQRPSSEWVTTYYVKDARGNTLAVYEQSTNQTTSAASFKIKERYIYGMTRIGADKTEVELIGASAPGNTFSRTIGDKIFDLVNHRGDVITSVTDRKIGIEDPLNLGTVAYYKPDIITTSETYLFGMPEPGRNIGLSNIRNGYQGQEKVDEINSKPGTHYTADHWELNTLTGRRENTDQVVKAGESGYATFANNPIYYSDPSGLDAEGGEDKTANQGTRLNSDASSATGGNYSRGGDPPSKGGDKPAFSVNGPQVEFKSPSLLSKIGNWFKDIFSVGIETKGQGLSDNPISTAVAVLPKHILQISGEVWDFLKGTFASKPNPYGPKKPENRLTQQEERLFDTHVDKFGEEKPEEDNSSFTAPGQNGPLTKVVKSQEVLKQTQNVASEAMGSSQPDTIINQWGNNYPAIQAKDSKIVPSNIGDTLILQPNGTIQKHPKK